MMGAMSLVVALPFRFAGSQVVYIDDASDMAAAQEIAVLASTGRTERDLFPGAGVPQPAFLTLDLRPLNAAIALWGAPGLTVTGATVERAQGVETVLLEFTR